MHLIQDYRLKVAGEECIVYEKIQLLQSDLIDKEKTDPPCKNHVKFRAFVRDTVFGTLTN